jgi:hypothetical protein
MCLVVVGVMIPAAPGMVGTFQAAVKLGLSIFLRPRWSTAPGSPTPTCSGSLPDRPSRSGSDCSSSPRPALVPGPRGAAGARGERGVDGGLVRVTGACRPASRADRSTCPRPSSGAGSGSGRRMAPFESRGRATPGCPAARSATRGVMAHAVLLEQVVHGLAEVVALRDRVRADSARNRRTSSSGTSVRAHREAGVRVPGPLGWGRALGDGGLGSMRAGSSSAATGLSRRWPRGSRVLGSCQFRGSASRVGQRMRSG